MTYLKLMKKTKSVSVLCLGSKCRKSYIRCACGHRCFEQGIALKQLAEICFAGWSLSDSLKLAMCEQQSGQDNIDGWCLGCVPPN